jgi:hypothetical protein
MTVVHVILLTHMVRKHAVVISNKANFVVVTVTTESLVYCL